MLENCCGQARQMMKRRRWRMTRRLCNEYKISTSGPHLKKIYSTKLFLKEYYYSLSRS